VKILGPIVVLFVIAACLAGSAAPAAGASWTLDAGADAIYEDNVGLAQLNRDIKADTALRTFASAGPVMLLGDSYVLSLTADVAGKLYERFTRLDNVAPGLSAELKRKFGLGAEAPWARLFGSVARLQYDDDLIRDGWIYRLGVGVGKRFGERWDLRLDYAYDRRLVDHEMPAVRGIPGDVYDLSGHNVALRADFLLNETISLFGSYAIRVGDVASTTQRNLQIFQAASAIAADPAFGRRFFAYRIDATTHTLGLGLSVALGRRSSFNVAYEHEIGDARGNITYHDNIFRVGVLFSY